MSPGVMSPGVISPSATHLPAWWCRMVQSPSRRRNHLIYRTSGARLSRRAIGPALRRRNRDRRPVRRANRREAHLRAHLRNATVTMIGPPGRPRRAMIPRPPAHLHRAAHRAITAAHTTAPVRGAQVQATTARAPAMTARAATVDLPTTAGATRIATAAPRAAAAVEAVEAVEAVVRIKNEIRFSKDHRALPGLKWHFYRHRGAQ
jgi:hypothetical protein